MLELMKNCSEYCIEWLTDFAISNSLNSTIGYTQNHATQSFAVAAAVKGGSRESSQ